MLQQQLAARQTLQLFAAAQQVRADLQTALAMNQS
jgi:hypothetical protein